MREGLTYADVLLIPNYSTIATRDDIDITSEYLGKKRLPIISAPMDFVTDLLVAMEMNRLGGYGIVSRFAEFKTPPGWSQADFGLAVGVRSLDDGLRQVMMMMPDTICIDVAHGDHKNVVDAIKLIKDYEPHMYVMAGNVATADGFLRLQDAGADAIRVGIGPGSACTTRETTGVGVPQLTAVLDCATVATSASLIADGGIQTPGDIVKALAAGADAVMLGNMLAGHDESPGEVVDGMKRYRGQSLLGSNGARNAPEGVEGLVPHRGPLRNTIEQLSNYIRSGMSYLGASNLQELQMRAEFIKVSPGTFNETKTRV